MISIHKHSITVKQRGTVFTFILNCILQIKLNVNTFTKVRFWMQVFVVEYFHSVVLVGYFYWSKAFQYFVHHWLQDVCLSLYLENRKESCPGLCRLPRPGPGQLLPGPPAARTTASHRALHQLSQTLPLFFYFILKVYLLFVIYTDCFVCSLSVHLKSTSCSNKLFS